MGAARREISLEGDLWVPTWLILLTADHFANNAIICSRPFVVSYCMYVPLFMRHPVVRHKTFVLSSIRRKFIDFLARLRAASPGPRL